MQTLAEQFAHCLIPVRPEKAETWLPKHIYMPAGLETHGPFDLDKFAHVRGVVQAWDDPDVRRIILIWGTRLAKTTTGCSLIVHGVHNYGRPGLVASSNKDTLQDLVDTKMYPLLESCRVTRPLLQPPHRRQVEKGIFLGDHRIRAGFSGSPSSLAGFPACYIFANEVSKWSDRKSSEADPMRLIMQRAKNYPYDSKEIFESSPGLKGRCKITELAYSQMVRRHRFVVPCCHCGTYQPLIFGSKSDGPGVKWQHDARGKSELKRAYDTGWYRCVNGCRIESDERARMLRSGLWLAEGQTIDGAGTISGEPTADKMYSAFIELGALYSPLLKGWGQLAVEWLECCHTAGGRQNFRNSTLAEIYDPAPRASTPEELGRRIAGTHNLGTVPLWGKFLTVGIDMQLHGELFAYVVTAWGDGGRGAEIAHGYCSSWQELVDGVLIRKWPHADGGSPLPILFGLMDSGDKEQKVYALCRRFKGIVPCKGSSMTDREYREVTLDAKQQKNKFAIHDTRLVHVSSEYTQGWLNRIIDGELTAEDPPFEIAYESAIDFDFLEQLLNEQRLEEIDKDGFPSTRWVRVEHHKPNDYRDCLRYAKVGASIVTFGGTRWHSLPSRVVQPASVESRQAPRGATTPDGRTYLVNQRN